jgi:4-hydroxybenzoate polyprenyltransferase
MRLPNVFTAVADVAMGYLVVQGKLDSPLVLGCLAAASALLYTAGMVLNDVFDIDVDRHERPFRPLPSGQIRLATARGVGFAMLAFGIAAGWAAGFVPAAAPAALPWRSGLVATILAAAVLLYDAYLKFTPLGPLGMGACRLLNVLLGMSAASHLQGAVAVGFSPAELQAAAGIGIYIAGVTLFARGEARRSRSGVLWAAMLVMTLGVAALATSGQGFRWQAMQTQHYWILLGLLMVTVLRRCAIAAFDPQPDKVQAAVKHSILTLILLDAATAAAVAGPLSGMAVAALLLPAFLLGRWVYST